MTTPDFFSAMLANLPASPTRWTRAYLGRIIDRCNKRIQTLDERVLELPKGRTMPDLDQVAIGSGKQYSLAILFLDICGFSGWPSSNFAEQRTVLKVLNVFMAEMMNILRDFDGYFEKNTGDGLMAYFGTETSDGGGAVRDAVEAAVIMHYVNDSLMTPWLQSQRFWPIRFRVAIDFGQVTIGRVGVPGGLNSFVAIGSSANIACKLMKLIPDGGICMGEQVKLRLPDKWGHYCSLITQSTGFIYVQSQQPYPAFCLNHRLSCPFF